LRHYIASGLNANSDYEQRRRSSEAFLFQHENDTTLRSILAQPLTFSEEDLLFQPSLDSYARFAFVLGFHNLGVALRDILNGYAPPSPEASIYERLDSPPLEAYKYIGHNDLSTPSPKRPTRLTPGRNLFSKIELRKKD